MSCAYIQHQRRNSATVYSIIIETMNVTAPQEALGIDEILRSIYGFVLGTDLNTITENMQMTQMRLVSNMQMTQMRLVSQHFNICFIAYLKSTPFKLHYDSRVRHIVQWMKGHDITRLNKLSIRTLGVDLKKVNDDVTGLHFSDLSTLDLRVSPRSTYSDEELQNFLCLFSEASSVTHLVVWDGHNSTSSSVIDMYKNFLSYFPILKSLVMGFGFNTDADTDSVKRSIKNCPQLERLVHRSLIGNYTLRSHSLKFLNLSSCAVDSICLDCPSLAELICHNPVVIGNTSGSALAEKFGNDKVAFIEKHPECYEPRFVSDILASVSIIPSDSIESTANNFFQVGNDCIITLFACMKKQQNH